MLDISKLLGIPYKLNGKTTDGFDCFGLVRYVYSAVHGIDIPVYDSPGEEFTVVNLVISEEIQNHCIMLNKPEPFCAVTFAIPVPFVTHIGIVLEDCRRFLHIRKGQRVAIEKLDHRFWSNRISGYYKWIN